MKEAPKTTPHRPGKKTTTTATVKAAGAASRPAKAPAKAKADTAQAKSEVAAPQAPHAKVAELAYAIFHERGCPHGQDQQHWLEAEGRMMSKL